MLVRTYGHIGSTLSERVAGLVLHRAHERGAPEAGSAMVGACPGFSRG